jgi:tetratricopeptide (TPR) repeat protein
MSENLKQEIQILINKYKYGDFSGVLNKCSLLVKKHPKNDFIWNLAGLSFQHTGDNQNAIKSFQSAIHINPKNNSAKNNLAISLKNNREYKKAEEILANLLKEKPDYFNALVNLANLKNDTYFFDEAISLYKKAISINKDSPELYLNISTVLQTNNKMDEARDYLFQALSLNKNFTKADQNLSMILNYKNEENDEHFKNMLDKLNNSNLSDLDKVQLYFGLGKAFEDKKDYESSFKHFEQGNKINIKSKKSFIKHYQQLSKDLKNYFSKLDLKKIKKNNNDDKKIFILGLPRSGTTLIEKIISSHSKVSTVSEIEYLYKKINQNIFKNQKFDENNTSMFIEQNIHEHYNDFLKFYNVKNTYIIDKTLTNFWYIGFIKIFFPNSKIIHSYRDPKDNCLSIYKNLFSNNEAWSYSEEQIGEYFLIYDDLMKFWNELFKNEIYNSKYEDIINDHEKKTKQLISFCGLEWEDNCLNHHKNNNPIKTLSINQANKPIYKTSINSSKFYSTKLSKLYSILDKLNASN